jgi:hypothetical protein
MSKHDEKLQQKSPVKTEAVSALDDKDLERVTGGDKAVVLQHEKVTGAGTAPAETVTFEYGGLAIKYGNQ